MKHSTDIVGSLLRIERTSIHDGPGLRTVIFLKGCPLRCRWCSTPESQRFDPERGYAADRCTRCGVCMDVCPEGALFMPEDGLKVRTDVSKCSHCFICVSKCPQGAIKKYGSLMSVRAVVREITKDEIFFYYSGGGVTISGGEPFRQPDFSAAVLRECRERGIHTAIESCLHEPYKSIEKALPWLNLCYVDIKHMDGESHKRWVGPDNSLILANIRRVDRCEYPLEIVVRIPLIPGANDSDTNLTKTAEFCKSLKRLKHLELLPYHRLGVETYNYLEREYSLKELVPPTRDWILERASFLSQRIPGVSIKIGGGYEERLTFNEKES